MKKFSLLFIFVCTFVGMKAQDMSIFEIYNRKGQKISYTDFVNNIATHDIILFGEMHNCPVTHWLEKRVAESLFNQKKEKLVLGAEMFETDNQLIINEFLQKIISKERFEKEARLWQNYATDYKPLIHLAQKYQLAFIATNIPRRYAKVVKEKGLKQTKNIVSRKAQQYIAPLPIPYESDPETIAFFKMMGGKHGANAEFMAQAQAIKDATMAWNIVQNTPKGHCFLHYNGSYHSDSASGIPFYLKKYAPQLKVVRISSVRQNQINQLEEKTIGKADFIIVVRADFPFSY